MPSSLVAGLPAAPSRYDGGDRQLAAAYARMEAAFAEAGLDWDGSPDAKASLQALRSTYEPLLDGLGRYMLLTLRGWVPDAGAANHWSRGHRGLLARRLVEQLSDRTTATTTNGGGSDEITWRELRKGLR